ncbi:MAG: mitochondrial fission ELM1 family protein, partial [Alphaproteobacteria bacterium]
RQSVAPAMAIGRASAKRCFTVQLLDPRTPLERFDLIVAPRHDGLSGANVIDSLGALHRVTPARLAAAAGQFAATVERLPHPRVAVLIGGATKHHRMTPKVAADLGDALNGLVRDQGASLMVTTSRRTGEANGRVLRERLEEGATLFWDGTGENPYFGYLGLADAILVTSDSVAMASEACATGKPVHVYDLPGGSAKFDRFHESLRQAGYARRFQGRIESWRYTPPDETARIATEIRRRMAIV